MAQVFTGFDAILSPKVAFCLAQRPLASCVSGNGKQHKVKWWLSGHHFLNKFHLNFKLGKHMFNLVFMNSKYKYGNHKYISMKTAIKINTHYLRMTS